MGLLLFNAISSVGGGVALMTDVIPEQVQWVQHNDSAKPLLPRRHPHGDRGRKCSRRRGCDGEAKPRVRELVSLLSGMIMVFWIIGEVASIRGFHFLQVVYLVTGS